MKHRTFAIIVLSACAALALVACGGGSADGMPTGNGNSPPPTAQSFSQHATWSFALPAKGEALCYDFDSQQTVANCQGTGWDLKVVGDGSSASFRTNGGVSGSGAGAAFGGPFDHAWSSLSTWASATVDPDGNEIPATAFVADASSGVFSGDNGIQSTAFEYDLQGDHRLWPTYNVFLISTDSSSSSTASTPMAPVYALQIIGYYGGPTGTESGHPTIRWIDRNTPDNVQIKELDASDGRVYFNLRTGEAVPQNGPQKDDWQIAFDRFNVSLNGGDSGPGMVAGFLGKTPAGFFNADGSPDAAAITGATPQSTLQYLTAADMRTPAVASDWLTDTHHSVLNPDYRGSFAEPPLAFGWYNYYPTAASATAAGLLALHMLKATPEGASLLRSGEGSSYARFHLTDIHYDAPTNSEAPNAAQQHWTIEFDIEPVA